jgi:hypothetical protein
MKKAGGKKQENYKLIGIFAEQGYKLNSET